MALLLTIFGIGFLLFIHELGHFMAARAAGVRVEVFALGMGPRLFGFRRGNTDYRISALPIGGYVQMKGEQAVDGTSPDSLHAKSVAARFFIYSGGIIMNFLFALLVIPILFRIGVPMQAAIAGSVEAGSPAWEAGIQPGDRFTSLDGRRLHSFNDFASSVALSDVDELLALEIQRGGQTADLVAVQARYDESSGFPVVGVGPGFSFNISPDSPSTRAGLPQGAELVAIDGVLFDEQRSLATLMLRDRIASGEPMAVEVRDRDGKLHSGVIEPDSRTVEGVPQLGVFYAANVVAQLREGHGTQLEIGDLVLKAGSEPVRSVDTIRLAAFAGVPELTVLRDGEVLQLDPQPARSGEDFAAFVHLSHQESGVHLALRQGGAAQAAGMLDGDQILRAQGQPIDDFESLRRMLFAEFEAGSAQLELILLRNGETINLSVPLTAAIAYDYGLSSGVLREVVRETGVVAAVGTGLAQARAMVRDVFLSFQRIVTGKISADNLGGIITIGRSTHYVASSGLVPLLFFLCMISIHLGVLNLLPIPALDGGHLFFLLIEAVRRKPVGQQVQIWFNLIGFVLIMTLVVFVTILDIRRLVP